MEIPEVAQPPELGGDLHNVIVLLLLEGGHVDVGETESLQVTHLTQERSECGQGGQTPGATHVHLLDTVQLHHIQDLRDTVWGYCRDHELLTAQMYGSFSLLHPPEKVGEEVIRGPFFQGKVCENPQWHQVLLCY